MLVKLETRASLVPCTLAVRPRTRPQSYTLVARWRFQGQLAAASVCYCGGALMHCPPPWRGRGMLLPGLQEWLHPRALCQGSTEVGTVAKATEGTGGLTRQIWQSPPSKSGWKDTGFFLPQDKQLSARKTGSWPWHSSALIAAVQHPLQLCAKEAVLWDSHSGHSTIFSGSSFQKSQKQVSVY